MKMWSGRVCASAVMGVVFLTGCGRVGGNSETFPKFVPVETDPSEAVDTSTGQLCLTYKFSDEDSVIASLRSAPGGPAKEKILADMDDDLKQRVLQRLKQPKGLPVCTDLRAELTTKHWTGTSAQ